MYLFDSACYLMGWLTQAYERCGPAKLAEMKKLTAIAKDAQQEYIYIYI